MSICSVFTAPPEPRSSINCDFGRQGWRERERVRHQTCLSAFSRRRVARSTSPPGGSTRRARRRSSVKRTTPSAPSSTPSALHSTWCHDSFQAAATVPKVRMKQSTAAAMNKVSGDHCPPARRTAAAVPSPGSADLRTRRHVALGLRRRMHAHCNDAGMLACLVLPEEFFGASTAPPAAPAVRRMAWRRVRPRSSARRPRRGCRRGLAAKTHAAAFPFHVVRGGFSTVQPSRRAFSWAATTALRSATAIPR